MCKSFPSVLSGITPTLRGCEQSVWASLTSFFLCLLSSPLPLPPPPHTLSVCHLLLTQAPRIKTREKACHTMERRKRWDLLHAVNVWLGGAMLSRDICVCTYNLYALKKKTVMTTVCLHVQSGGLCLRFYLPACITGASQTCRHRCTPCGYRFISELIKQAFNTRGWLITATVVWCLGGFWDCWTQHVRLKIQERMAPVGSRQTVMKEAKSNDFIWGCVADSGDGRIVT